MSAIVRPAIKEDHPTIIPIGLETQDLHANAHPEIFMQGMSGVPFEYFSRLLEREDTMAFVAELEGRIVGYVLMKVQDAPQQEELLVARREAFIDDIAILKAYQGRGIGRQLFQACAEWAKAHRAVSLDLRVWEFNKNAIAFYERLGMKTVSRIMSLPL